MLDDIVFQTGDAQEFIVEISAGTLNAPIDILFGSHGNDMLVNELTLVAGNQEKIVFIVV